MTKLLTAFTLFSFLTLTPIKTQTTLLPIDDEIAKSGCCSHHGGVCGCEEHTVVCCDKSYSPSCTCLTDENPESPVACNK